MREPYADRFRLILNDLGAGFAARGEDLAAIIERADPALRETNRVLAELASQNQAAQPARARRRHDHAAVRPRAPATVSGFINNANVAAEATAERSQDLEAGFQRFPEALRQLRLTMAKLRDFSDQATPVFAEFRDGGPAIARATGALGPFADAAEPSLTSLGTAAEQSRQPLLNSDPILRDDPRPGEEGGARRQAASRGLLANLRKTGFHEQFMQLLFNTTGAINGYDQYGHFLRAWLLPITACMALARPPRRVSCQRALRSDSAARPRRARRLVGGRRSERDHRLGRTWRSAGPGERTGRPCGNLGAQSRRRTATIRRREPSGRSLGAARALLDTMIGRQQRSGPGAAGDPPPRRRHRLQPGAGRRDHDPDRDPRRLPRLQRQQRPAVRAHLQDLGPGAERQHAASRATTCGSAECGLASSRRSSRFRIRRPARFTPRST